MTNFEPARQEDWELVAIFGREIAQLRICELYSFDEKLVRDLAMAAVSYTQCNLLKERHEKARGLARDGREKIENTGEKLEALADDLEKLIHDLSINPHLMEQFREQFGDEDEGIEVKVEHAPPWNSPFLTLTEYSATYPERAPDEQPAAQKDPPKRDDTVVKAEATAEPTPWESIVATRTVDRMRRFSWALASVSKIRDDSKLNEDLINYPQSRFVYLVFQALREFVEDRDGMKELVKPRVRAEVAAEVFRTLDEEVSGAGLGANAGSSARNLRLRLGGAEYSSRLLANIYSRAKPPASE